MERIICEGCGIDITKRPDWVGTHCARVVDLQWQRELAERRAENDRRAQTGQVRYNRARYPELRGSREFDEPESWHR